MAKSTLACEQRTTVALVPVGCAMVLRDSVGNLLFQGNDTVVLLANAKASLDTGLMSVDASEQSISFPFTSSATVVTAEDLGNGVFGIVFTVQVSLSIEGDTTLSLVPLAGTSSFVDVSLTDPLLTATINVTPGPAVQSESSYWCFTALRGELYRPGVCDEPPR